MALARVCCHVNSVLPPLLEFFEGWDCASFIGMSSGSNTEPGTKQVAVKSE